MFKKISKIIFIFIFFFFMFGCSKKYVARTDRELLDRKVFALWDDLDGRIVGRSEKSFCLNLRIMEFVKVRDSLKIKEVYRSGLKNRDGEIKRSSLRGFTRILLGGGIAGCSVVAAVGVGVGLGMSGSPPSQAQSCLPWVLLAGVPLGIIVSAGGISESGYKSVKVIPPFAKVDTVCVDSVSLFFDSVTVRIEDRYFEKKCLPDSCGNINLKFDEFIPEPSEADSVLNLIIQYEELVDTVDLKIK